MALATLDAMESEMMSSPSRSGSGCQSGWTLYLDHSNGAARYVPCGGDDPAAATRWMVLQAERAGDQEEEEDSMASDASSGPRPRLREPEGDELERRDSELRHGFFADHRSSRSYSTRARSSASGSSCFGSSTWSSPRILHSQDRRGPAKGDVDARTAVIFRGDERTATRPYREIIVIDDDDGNDELDDTASSSGVFSCPTPMVACAMSSFSS